MNITSRNRKMSRRNFEIPRLSELASPSPHRHLQVGHKCYSRGRNSNIHANTNSSVKSNVNDWKMHISVEQKVQNHELTPEDVKTFKAPARESESKKRECDRQKRLPFSPLSNSLGNRNRERMDKNSSEGCDWKAANVGGRTNHRYLTPKSKSTTKKRGSSQIKDSSLPSSKKKISRQQHDKVCSRSKSVVEDDNTKEDTMKLYPSKILHDENESLSSSIQDAFTLEYPKVLKISKSLFKSAFRESLKNGTHQKQLCESGCDQLSLTETIIPATFQAHNLQLKKMEGKALGKGHKDVVRDIQMLRCALKEVESNAINAVEVLRDEKAEKRKLERLDAKQARMKKSQEERERREQEKLARKVAKKEAMLEVRAKNREKKRKDRKTKYFKNKELYREFGKLMTDLAILEREEKGWKEATFEKADSCDDEYEYSQSKAALEACLKNVEEDRTIGSSIAQSIAQDIAVSANRINNVLCELSSFMEKSERIKNEAYEKYRKDHKFHGYLGQKNPRALIRAMNLTSL